MKVRQIDSLDDIILLRQNLFGVKSSWVGNINYALFFQIDELVFTMKPGNYKYIFQCNLPTTLPTSLEGESGYIRYTACVYFDRIMWPDQIFEEPFTVINPSLNITNIKNPWVVIVIGLIFNNFKLYDFI